MKLCSIEDCTKTLAARGMCQMHYRRWKLYGDPHTVKVKKYDTPEEAFAARTEWQGDCLIWTGSRDKAGYRNIGVGGRVLLTHRYAWEREYGPIPEGMLVDHKDHCSKSCVNVRHLRLASKMQNCWNRAGANQGNITGLRNIHLRDNGRYMVRIVKDGKRQYYGTYDELETAVEVRDAARRELYGEFAGKG